MALNVGNLVATQSDKKGSIPAYRTGEEDWKGLRQGFSSKLSSLSAPSQRWEKPGSRTGLLIKLSSLSALAAVGVNSVLYPDIFGSHSQLPL